MKPLCIDLFSGLHGWAEPFAQEGYRVKAFDLFDMHKELGIEYERPPEIELFLRDVREIHGSEFADAACIVASPPCTEYSYIAMPWSRAKRIARALRHPGADFPEVYTGSRTIEQLNELLNACFRIQREASEAAGRYIPLIVENVKGAQPWVGRAAWHFGSFYLWGDVPALMPTTLGARKNGDKETGEVSPRWRMEGIKVGNARRLHGKNSVKRRAASAQIARIPEPLAKHIAQCFYPK